MAATQQLQKIFVHFKKSTSNLPLGCGSIELVDDDDISEWFVRLDYSPDAAGNTQATVSVKLQFRIDEGSDLMPMVFIIQPRLMASFIHYGAVCSLDLMSLSWAYTIENVTLLLQSLQATLDPGQDSITVDLNQPTYTSAEHSNGIRFIKAAHETLFRKKVVASTTTHSVVTQNDVTAVSKAHVEDSGVRKVTTNLSPQVETVTNGAELSSVVEAFFLQVERDAVVALHICLDTDKPVRMMRAFNFAKPCRIHFTASANAAHSEQRLKPKLIWSCKRFCVPPGCELMFDGTDVEISGGALTVGGIASFTNSTFVGSLTAEGSARVLFLQCQILGTCQSRDQGETLTALDRSHVELLSCNVARVDRKPQRTVKCLILVSNEASLRLSDGCVVTPIRCEKTIFAEQEASLVVSGSIVVSGSSCAVAVQACTATLSDSILEGPLSNYGALTDDDSSWRTGLKGELGARLHATNCVARSLHYGFYVFGSSKAEFDRCFVDNTVMGFFVSASTSTLNTCDVSSDSTGLCVVQNGKCIVTSSAVARSLGLQTAGNNRSEHPLRHLGDPRCIADKFDAQCSKFSGGGIEVWDACFVAGGVFVDGTTSSCVFVSGSADATLMDCTFHNTTSDVSEDKRSAGVNVNSGGKVNATRCHVSGGVYGFLACEAETHLTATECSCRLISNGFGIIAATATLSFCRTESAHNGILVSNGGNCTVSGGDYVADDTVFGLKQATLIARGGVRVHGFSCSGVSIFAGSSANCTDLVIEGSGGGQQTATGVEVHAQVQATLKRVAVSSVNWAMDIYGGSLKATKLSTDPATCRNGIRVNNSASLFLDSANIRVQDVVLQTQGFETSVATASGSALHIFEGATIMHATGGTWHLNGVQCRQTSAGTPLFAKHSSVNFSNCHMVLLGEPSNLWFTECSTVCFKDTSVAVDAEAPVLFQFQQCSVRLTRTQWEHVVLYAGGCPEVSIEAAALSNARLINVTSATITNSIITTRRHRVDPALVVEKSSNAIIVNSRLFARDSSLALLVTSASRCTVRGETELHCIFKNINALPEVILVTNQSGLVCLNPPRVTSALVKGSKKCSRSVCTVLHGSKIHISQDAVDGLQIDCDSTSHSSELMHRWWTSVWFSVVVFLSAIVLYHQIA